MFISNQELIYEREVYNLLDLIGDLGGLFDGLVNSCKFLLLLLGLVIQQPINRYITRRVFFINQEDMEDETKGGCCWRLFSEMRKNRRVYRQGVQRMEE